MWKEMNRKRNLETLLRACLVKYVLTPFLRLSSSAHNKSTKWNWLKDISRFSLRIKIIWNKVLSSAIFKG